MSTPIEGRYEFVPTASIIAFVFIGIFILISLIGRCLALNQSNIRSTQSLDLVIYRAPPKANPPQQRGRPVPDSHFGLVNSREKRPPMDGAVTPVSVQRGPKNL